MGLDFESYSKKWYVHAFIIVLLLFYLLYFSYDIRDGQQNLDGLRPRVADSIYAQVQNGIADQVSAQFPFASEQYKQNLIQQELRKVRNQGFIEINGERIDVEAIITQQTDIYKTNFQFADGQTYLGSIDPYYYLALADNYVSNGHTGDTLDANGRPLVSRMLAPEGVSGSYRPEFNVWIMAQAYKWNDVTESSPISEKFKAVFFLPVWLSMIAAIPCFFIIRRYGNNLTAFFGTLVCMSIGIFVSRTVAGSPDNDPYYVSLPLIIAAFFVYALSEKKYWLAIVYAILAGMSQGIISLALANAWFILFFIIVASLGYIGYLLVESVISKKIHLAFSAIKKELLLLGVYLVSGFISGLVFVQINIFTTMVDAIRINVNAISSFDASFIWPNVLSSVAELNPADFAGIINGVGGRFIFVLAILGLVFMALDFKSQQSSLRWYKIGIILFAFFWLVGIVFNGMFVSLTSNSKLLFLILLFAPVGLALVWALINKVVDAKIALVILLSVWIAGTIYMSFNGVRFIMLLGPAFAIAFGLCLYHIFKFIEQVAVKELGITTWWKKPLISIIVVGILFLVIFSPISRSAYAISEQPSILFDTGWFTSMETLREQSAVDAIVTSWWDFGHFFHAIGKRAITFDGASQSIPQAHWVGRLLLENDMAVAHDLNRMLVCGANRAFDRMYEYTGDVTGGVNVVKVIYQTFGVDVESKKSILRQNEFFTLTDEQVDSVMEVLYCENPRDNVFIASGDMVNKAGVWAHWGLWDFDKKFVHDKYTSMSTAQMAEQLQISESVVQAYVAELRQIDVRSRAENLNRNALINQYFSPYPSYLPVQGGYFINCVRNETLYNCGGMQIDIENNLFSAPAPFNQYSYRRIVVPANNDLQSFTLSETGQLDVLFIPSDGQPRIMLAQYPLGASLFTRLYFLQGYGAQNYELFSVENSITASNIYMYHTNWSK